MATNYHSPGDVLTLTAPSGGVVSGTGYVIGSLFVVALGTAAQTMPFEGKRTGVFRMPKATHATDIAFAEGEAVFYNNTTKVWNKTAGGLIAGAGIVVKAAASTANTCEVMLTGNPVTTV
jgi:predicted RecA/RadA family phage recombinase